MASTGQMKVMRPVLKAVNLLKAKNEIFMECFETFIKHKVVQHLPVTYC